MLSHTKPFDLPRTMPETEILYGAVSAKRYS